MLDKTSLAVDPKLFTPAHVAIIKRAASYPQVERMFVNPAIKKALCQAAGKDRAWLGKVRPIWGHNYHFHIRIGCPNGGCQVQPPVEGDDGCGKEVDNWLKTIEASLKKPQPKPGVKIIPDSERRQVTMEQLPPECKIVLNSPGTKPRHQRRGRLIAGVQRQHQEVTRPRQRRRHRAGDARAAEPAVAVRHLRQVLLVIVLGEEELRRGQDLGGDLPQAVLRQRLLVLGLRGFRRVALRLA